MINGYGEKLENLYMKIRADNFNEQLRRKNEIKKKNPKLIELEQQVLDSLNSITKRSPNNLKEKIERFKEEKKRTLNLLGLEEDFLDAIYTCKKCKDTGYILTTPCDCFYKNLGIVYLENSDLNKLIKTNNFDNFNFSYYSTEKNPSHGMSANDNIKNIYANILKYIKNFNSINTNLLFYGDCGSGKTFLSHCIASELLKKGVLVIYLTSEDLFNELISYSSFKNNNKLEKSIITQCDLLIIDDLGTESSNAVYHSLFFNFLNKKLILNKKMLISTNFTLKYIQENYSERISSRILGEFALFKFFIDKDIRIQKKINGA